MEVAPMAENGAAIYLDSSQKLRHSCNNCHAAKVRCSGEKTGCRRCKGLNEPCIFSISRVGKVVGNRGKYKQSKKKQEQQQQQQQQQQKQRQNSQPQDQQQDLTQDQQRPPWDTQSEHAAPDESLAPVQLDAFTHTTDDGLAKEHGTPNPQSHQPWGHQTPSPFAQPNLGQQPPATIAPHALREPARAPSFSRAATPGRRGTWVSSEQDFSTAPSSARHSISAPLTDWMDAGDAFDACGTLGHEFDDLLAMRLQGSAAATPPDSALLGHSGVHSASLDDFLLGLPELGEEDYVPLSPPSTDSLGTAKPVGRLSPDDGFDFLNAGASASGAEARPDSSGFSMAATPPFLREHSKPTEPAQRANWMLNCARLLSAMETHYEKLQDLSSGKTTQSLDKIMETGRRATEAARSLIVAGGPALTAGSVRILTMVLELLTRILQEIIKTPALAAQLDVTFGSFSISEGDRKWLRKRVLCTEVQRTLALVKSLRSSCALIKSYGGMCATTHDECLQAMQRSLKQMLVELTGDDAV